MDVSRNDTSNVFRVAADATCDVRLQSFNKYGQAFPKLISKVTQRLCVRPPVFVSPCVCVYVCVRAAADAERITLTCDADDRHSRNSYQSKINFIYNNISVF